MPPAEGGGMEINMKKSSVMLLGYGLGYIVISCLIGLGCISFNSKDLVPLSIASLLFSLAEFFNFGGRLILLTIRQLYFRLFAGMSYKRFLKFKKYVENKYVNKPNNMLFNINMYYYWSAKCVANYFSEKIQKQYEKQNKTCLLTLMLYVLAPVALVCLMVFSTNGLLQTTEAFNNAITIFPLGFMFINVFFESEYIYIMEKFYENVHVELERLKKATDEFKEIFNKKADNA